jgi:hypothetical protein
MPEMMGLLAFALLKAVLPEGEKILERILAGEDIETALDHERVNEVLPIENKLALAMEMDRIRRRLPPDPEDAPSAPSDR